MSISRGEPADHGQARLLSLPSPFRRNLYGVRDSKQWNGATSEYLLNDLQSDFSPHEPVRASASSNFSAHQSPMLPLGKPKSKNRISISDLSGAALSLVCLAMSVMAVADETVSWRLGVANNQLIVVGFLLNIMNLCLASVTSTFFLLIEARFGSSILQNYDGILRNKPTASRLGLPWRAVLTLFISLPIAISVAYKTFKGGQSSKIVESAEYVSIPTYYGMVAPSGLMVAGQGLTGLSQYFNATQAFQALSSPVNGSEPPLPRFPQSYGYNILLLDENSSAVLDVLQPDFITSVQAVLAEGESWVVSAPVIGTVATLNTSKAEDPVGFESAIRSACTDKDWFHNSMNFWSKKPSALWLMDQADLSDQSIQYVAFPPKYDMDLDCLGVTPYFQLYNVYRQQCQGTWSITRAGIELSSGFCHGGPLPENMQQMVVWNMLKLTDIYLPILLDFLSPFSPAGYRNQSKWNGPYMATAVVAMFWSRVVAIDTIDAPLGPDGGYNTSHYAWTTSSGTRLSFDDIKMLYHVDPSDQTIHYVRPTLRKSPLLYFILAVQPLLIVAILIVASAMHSVPLDKGFGLVSILAGINRHTLDILSGASLSGELTQRVKLVIFPADNGHFGKLDLQVMPVNEGSNGKKRLREGVIYD